MIARRDTHTHTDTQTSRLSCSGAFPLIVIYRGLRHIDFRFFAEQSVLIDTVAGGRANAAGASRKTAMQLDTDSQDIVTWQHTNGVMCSPRTATLPPAERLKRFTIIVTTTQR